MNIPDPAAYGISPKYGFLSPSAPLSHFPNPYYAPWDRLASSLPSLLQSGLLSAEIEHLPLLSTTSLGNDELAHRRAYVLLAFIIHAHVWRSHSDGQPNELIPPQLAEPFLAVCDFLGIEPVITYAGLCLWNWRLLDSEAGMTLENLEVLASFTGTVGERAFYHAPVLTEVEGGPLVCVLVDALGSIAGEGKGRDKETREVIVRALEETTETLRRMGKVLGRLYEVLDPAFFYNEHRPYMAGGKGMEEKGLRRGMVFQRSDGSEIAAKLAGGSAVQSSLFPFLDYVLGVKHVDSTLFSEMRPYMPRPHRDFLTAIAHLASNNLTLRAYVLANPDYPSLRLAYDKCLDQLRAWRGRHIALVSRYVVQPARAAEEAAKRDVNAGGKDEGNGELQGTGGTAVMPFLRRARDDTVGV